MIITEERPKERRNSNPEGKLQAKCVLWFNNTYPERRGSLFAVFNEGQAVNTKLSTGLVPGVSDLLLYDKFSGALTGIELKAPKTRHSRNHIMTQAKWLITIPKKGCFCDNYEDFRNIVENGCGGIDPKLVLNYCNSIKTSTFEWDSKKITNG